MALEKLVIIFSMLISLVPPLGPQCNAPMIFMALGIIQYSHYKHFDGAGMRHYIRSTDQQFYNFDFA